MKELTFPVSVSTGRCGGGDFDISYKVTDEEYAKLIEERDKWNNEDEEEANEFCDVEELSDLYDRLYEQAIDDTVGSLRDDDCKREDLTDENGEFDEFKAYEYVTDYFDFCIDYPYLEEDEEI